MEKEYFRNIWELYGVRDNPFSTSPLLVKGGPLPIDCFVGRAELIKRLGKVLSSKGGSRSFVYGDVGVGKTSFVNFVRYKAIERKFFTPFKEIAAHESWTPEDFILNTLAAIYATLKILKEKPVSKGLLDKLESLLEIVSLDISAGLNVSGFGGSYGRSRKGAHRITVFSLHEFFEEVVRSIVKSTGKEVIIHYNNLELLPENRLKAIFENLRDFFQTANAHFIFIGNLTTHGIIQGLPRVASIFPDTPLHVENLTLQEVKEIIERRFSILKIEGLNQIMPFTDDCLKKLYNLMDGNIRYILNSLSTAVSEATQEKPIVLNEEYMSIILRGVLDKRYLANLTQREKDVLMEIVRHKEITNKALSALLILKSSNVSQYLKELESAGCIFLRRKSGKDKLWSAEHRIRWALLETPKSGQEPLYKYF